MLKQNNLVSVIMPTYNRAEKILKAVKSVQNQSYENWELIIVDDHSIDHTETLIADIIKDDARIKYSKLEKNIGASGARNVGLRLAKGKYITFLDSDDEYYPQKIEKQVNLFLSSSLSNLGIVSCGAIDFKNGVEYNRRMPVKQENYVNSLLSKTKRIGAGTPFLMIKSHLVRDNQILFDESLIAMEDWDFVLRIVAVANFDFVNEYLVKVNHHGDERLYNSKNAAISLDVQYEKYKNILIQNPKSHKSFVKNAASIKAHHISIKSAINFINKTLQDYSNIADKREMVLFKYFLNSFYIKPIKLWYLKYYK